MRILDGLFGLIVDYRVRKWRKSLKPLDWGTLLDSIAPEIDGCRVYLGTREGLYVPISAAESQEQDIVAVAVEFPAGTLPIWECEEPAQALASRIRARTDQQVDALIGRLPPLNGWFVRVRPY